MKEVLEDCIKKTEPEYYPPVENLLDLIYEHYTENNPVEKNTVAGKAAKEKEKELEVLWSSVFVTLVAKKDLGSYALTRAS